MSKKKKSGCIYVLFNQWGPIGIGKLFYNRHLAKMTALKGADKTRKQMKQYKRQTIIQKKVTIELRNRDKKQLSHKPLNLVLNSAKDIRFISLNSLIWKVQDEPLWKFAKKRFMNKSTPMTHLIASRSIIQTTIMSEYNLLQISNVEKKKGYRTVQNKKQTSVPQFLNNTFKTDFHQAHYIEYLLQSVSSPYCNNINSVYRVSSSIKKLTI